VGQMTRRRRCVNFRTCKRHATVDRTTGVASALCGPCYWREHDRTLRRRMAALRVGERLELGGGWCIVRWSATSASVCQSADGATKRRRP